MDEEKLRTSKNFGMMTAWKQKKRKTLKFVDARSKTRLREKGVNNMEWIDKEECRRKIKLSGTERCENIDTLYIEIIIIIIIIIIILKSLCDNSETWIQNRKYKGGFNTCKSSCRVLLRICDTILVPPSPPPSHLEGFLLRIIYKRCWYWKRGERKKLNLFLPARRKLSDFWCFLFLRNGEFEGDSEIFSTSQLCCWQEWSGEDDTTDLCFACREFSKT